MSTITQRKGPAALAGAPSHGSINTPPNEMIMNMDTNITAADDQQGRDPIWEARDLLTRIKNLNELVFLAGEGMLGMSRKSANAICAGCDTIGNLLEEVCDLIDGRDS